MSDGFFDAARDRGEYPPKGWGWHEHSEQLEMAKRWYEKGSREPWLIEFIEYYLPDLIKEPTP